MSIIPKYFQNAIDAASLKISSGKPNGKIMAKEKRVQRVMTFPHVYIRRDL